MAHRFRNPSGLWPAGVTLPLARPLSGSPWSHCGKSQKLWCRLQEQAQISVAPSLSSCLANFRLPNVAERYAHAKYGSYEPGQVAKCIEFPLRNESSPLWSAAEKCIKSVFASKVLAIACKYVAIGLFVQIFMYLSSGIRKQTRKS